MIKRISGDSHQERDFDLLLLVPEDKGLVDACDLNIRERRYCLRSEFCLVNEPGFKE